MKLSDHISGKLVKLLIIVLLIAPTLALSGCGDVHKKVAQAVNDVAIGLDAASQSLSSMNKQGLLDDATYAKVIKIEAQAVEIDDAMRKLLQASKVINATNKASYLALVSDFVITIQQLQDTGALGIKSADAKARFSAVTSSILIAIKVVQDFLANVTSPVSTNGLSLAPRPQTFKTVGPSGSIWLNNNSTIVPYTIKLAN